MSKPSIAVVKPQEPKHVSDLQRPALSPARQALANARKARAAVGSVMEAAATARARADRLIAAPAPLKAKLAELERAAGAVVEAWARSGTAGAPTLPGGDDLDALRREIVEAERVAEAARAAIPALSRDTESAQAAVRETIDQMREAAAAVLMEHADEMIAELIEVDRRAATIRGQLRGLRHHFQLDGMRGNAAAGALGEAIRRKTPQPIAMTDTEAERIAAAWSRFADRLLGDEAATLEI